MSEALNDVAFDLDLEDTLLSTSEATADESTCEDSRGKDVPVRSITNSPGCTPDSGGASSDSSSDVRPIRRPRTVRVDAWAVPASANWTRTRKTIRKVQRVSRSTDWALPF